MKKLIERLGKVERETLIKTRRYISVGLGLVVPVGLYFNVVVLVTPVVVVLIAIWYLPVLLSGGTK